MESTSMIWHVQVNTPLSTTPTVTQNFKTPAALAGVPWRWVRVRNYYNWRVGTAYAITSPWYLTKINLSAEGYNASFTSTAPPYNGSTSYVTTIRPDALNGNLDGSQASPWAPLHAEFFPAQVQLMLEAVPLGNNSNAFETISVVEFEFSLADTPPMYT